eukprot:CAMPEP_0178412558 /NCGR_PEP_ID=MMETSP0689_2-20121128/22076_1 /TAXON_ID=160604 /ORGANISM="Amphidinium massartii, Strain CS-259" /LENGTH=362 /DNA_ID=CAMNT_0020033807 /DNA_START=30 /DNA_END=1118 /DNA_ORIENTATION=-
MEIYAQQQQQQQAQQNMVLPPAAAALLANTHRDAVLNMGRAQAHAHAQAQQLQQAHEADPVVAQAHNHALAQVHGPEDIAAQDEIISLVQDLRIQDRRENALLELSKRRESFAELAPILWYSFGTIVALMQEIVSVYPQLTDTPTLSPTASNRVCNSLALLQCIASHPETRPLFLKAQIPNLLFPFLTTKEKERPFEYLRLTSLGVIGALVKVDDPEVIGFLLQTGEILTVCLKIMECGSELSKTVATFVVQKLLLDDMGLQYICATSDRFYSVANVLAKMVDSLQQSPSIRLLKHVVRCYLRLADNPHARNELKGCLPDCLQAADPATLQQLPEPIANCLREDSATKRWLHQLLTAVQMSR